MEQRHKKELGKMVRNSWLAAWLVRKPGIFVREIAHSPGLRRWYAKKRYAAWYARKAQLQSGTGAAHMLCVPVWPICRCWGRAVVVLVVVAAAMVPPDTYARAREKCNSIAWVTSMDAEPCL